MSKPIPVNAPPVKPTPQIIELPELAPHGETGPSILSGNLEVIQNVRVELAVQVGHASASIGELLRMQEAHILKLDTPLDTPVDVLLDGHVVARGHLVAVDDHFGIRISEIPTRTGA